MDEPGAGSVVGWDVPGVGVRALDGSLVPEGPVFGSAAGVQAPVDLESLVGALRVVAAGVASARDGLPGVCDAGVVELMVALGEAACAVETMTVETTAAALLRGLPRGGAQALSPVEWVRTHHVGLRGLGAGPVVAVAELLTHPGLAEIAEGVRCGAVPVATAAVAAAETRKVLGALPARARTEQTRAQVAAVLVTAAASGVPRLVRSAAVELIGAHAGPDGLDRLSERAHVHRELSGPADLGGGLFDYRFRTDALAMATLEAALDPLSKPIPGPDGEPDPRTARQRRADALITLVETSVAAPDGPACGLRGQLHLTMTLDALTGTLTTHLTGSTRPGAGLGSGSVLGLGRGAGAGPGAGSGPGAGAGSVPGPGAGSVPGSGSGLGLGRGAGAGAPGTCGSATEPVSSPGVTTTDPTPFGSIVGQGGAAATARLSPTQVRQFACAAGIVPVVLGGDGVILDQGPQVRLFPAHLVKRLWLRDRGCTFPGCTMPAKWTQAHHLTWHRHAGPTTLANGALLCSHHHHVVHARHLLGRLDPTTNTITWDLTPGSYTHPPDP